MANSMSIYRQNGVDYTIDDPTIAPVFVETAAYTIGQYVKHAGNLYRFITDHAAGAWNASEVAQVTAGREIADLRSALNKYDRTFNTTTHDGKFYILEDNSRIPVVIHPGQIFRIYADGTAVRRNTTYSVYFNRTSIYSSLYTEKWYILRAFTEITELSFYGELNSEATGTFRMQIEVFNYDASADYWLGTPSSAKPVFVTPEVALDGYVATFNSLTAVASANYAITESIPLTIGQTIIMFGKCGSNVAAVSKYDSETGKYTAVAGNAEGGCFTYTADEACNVRLCYVKGTAAACVYTTMATTMATMMATTMATTRDADYIKRYFGYNLSAKVVTPLDVEGKYVNKANPPVVSSYNNCYMSGPIAVSKHELIHVNVYVNNATTPIAYCNQELTSFEKIDPAYSDISGRGDIYFIADRDGYICVSANINTRISNYYEILSLDSFSELAADVQENTDALAELTDNTEYVVENRAICQSKNLFDKDAVIEGCYVSSANGTLSYTSHSSVSPLIPVTPGDVYHLYRDGLGGTHEVRFVAADGTTPMKALREDGTEFSSYMSSASPTVKAPVGAAYFQFTVRFNNKADTYETIQFEEGNTKTEYEPYVHYPYLDYTALPPGLEGLPERVDEIASQPSLEQITIANSGKIGFFSNSFLNGYTMRTHHALDNLGMWSDYIMYNYGKSGDDALETLARIDKNETFFGDVPVQKWGLSYGVIAMQDNDGALLAADPETYYENFKKIAEAIRAMGAIPILGTEHDWARNYYGLMALAEHEGYLFMDWGKMANAMGRFTPFWQNGHPATRTAWLWSNGMKPYLDSLPRPERGIKLFRKRPDTGTALSDLIYNNLYERAERYVEIDKGYSCLNAATEKYFDRLNNNLTTYEYIKDEYQKLQSGSTAVNFGTHALIECITPYSSSHISYLKMHLAATGVTHAYIKRNLSLANPLPANRYVAFGISAGERQLPAGTTFKITGGVFNKNILGTYTVSQVLNGMVITTTSSTGKTTSGTDNPTTDVSGVTLVGSYDYPSADYMQRFDLPLAEWDEFALDESNVTELTSLLKTHMDYDKVAILLIGTNVTVSEVYFDVAGGEKKQRTSKSRTAYKKGTTLLSSTLLDDGTNWNNISSVTKYAPVVSAVDNVTVEPLPSGITTVRVLKSGDEITQTFDTSGLNADPYHLYKLQVRILARYFPKYIDTDAKWATTEIYEGSYDCAALSVKINDYPKCAKFAVGAFWNEYIADIYYQNQGNTLKIQCDNKSVQIAKVELELVEVT